MRRYTIALLITLALSLLMAPLAAKAHQAGGTVTIGYLGNASPCLESNIGLLPRTCRILL
jgi:hypothetical protein